VTSSLLRRNISLLAFMMAVSLVGWLWAVPAFATPSTFAVVAVCMFAGTAIALTTWRNAQATTSTAQLLHATDTASSNVDVQR
jgi:FtsH-binding integral membrane protein